MADKRVVIVGGGFAGIKAARQLADQTGFAVSLISNKDYFCYYPTLYHSATGHPGSESSIPLATIFKGTNVKLVIDTVTELHTTKRTVSTQSGRTIAYDELIVALGVVTSYFGIAGLEEYSYGVKSIEQILELKNHFHQLMVEENQPDLNYLVVGAGPTGVELAAAMGSYLRQVARHYKLPKRRISISLIEAAPRVLPRSSERVSKLVTKRLKQLGVKVMTNQKVEGNTAESLTVSGQKIPSHTVIWTAGVTNHPFFKDHPADFTLNERGKVVVDEHLQAAPHIYVIGDNAATPYSGLAQIAVHDGAFVADHLLRLSRHQESLAYQAHMPTTVVPVGHNWAIVESGKISFGGWPGHLMRRAADLVGYWDVLPARTALGLWLARHDHQEDYLTIAKKGRSHVSIK